MNQRVSSTRNRSECSIDWNLCNNLAPTSGSVPAIQSNPFLIACGLALEVDVDLA